jgi:hypothetical protein
MSPRLQRPEAKGTSLTEVVIAMGLLAGLLVSVAGLLTLGNRHVRGGARASQALTVARTVLEDLEVVGYDRAYRSLGCDGALPACRAASGQPVVAAWHELAETDLHAPRVEVRIEALGAISLDGARALRITVTVGWREGLRERRVQLTTLRV